MITKTFNITVDFNKSIRYIPANFVQGDVDTCIINITSAQELSDTTVIVAFLLPDTTTKYILEATKYETKKASLIIPTGCLAQIGTVTCQVSLHANNQRLTNAVSFSFNVVGDISDGAIPPNEDTVPILTKLISDVDILSSTKMELDGSNSNVGKLTFNTAGATINGAGQLGYNPAEGTLDIGLNDGTILQTGQKTHYHVTNKTNFTIPDGTVVMASGTIGNTGKITITPAIANGTYPSEYIMGITTHNIAKNGNGYVTCFGKIRDIDTTGNSVGETWADGDVLYAHPIIPGALTKAKPTSPSLKVMMAIVIHANSSGTLFVRPTYGSVLGGTDSNVEINNPDTDDILIYNKTTGIWINSDKIKSLEQRISYLESLIPS